MRLFILHYKRKDFATLQKMTYPATEITVFFLPRKI